MANEFLRGGGRNVLRLSSSRWMPMTAAAADAAAADVIKRCLGRVLTFAAIRAAR